LARASAPQARLGAHARRCDFASRRRFPRRQRKTDNSLTKIEPLYYVCSRGVLKEEGECPVPSKAFRLPEHASVWLRRLARPARSAREEPFLALLNGGVFASVAAPEGRTAKRARREMVPQRLEKVESAPGNGMVPAALEPQYLVAGAPRPYLPLAGHASGGRQIRLAASPAGDMDSSSRLDDPCDAHDGRASARGLRLARRQPHGEIARRR